MSSIFFFPYLYVNNIKVYRFIIYLFFFLEVNSQNCITSYLLPNISESLCFDTSTFKTLE